MVTYVIGPNGAGKSTYLQRAAGIRTYKLTRLYAHVPKAPYGEVAILGALTPGMGLCRLRTFLEKHTPDLPDAIDRRERLTDLLGLRAFLTRYSWGVSEGIVRKAWIIATLLVARPLTIIDEADSYLDEASFAGLQTFMQEDTRPGRDYLISVQKSSLIIPGPNTTLLTLSAR